MLGFLAAKRATEIAASGQQPNAWVTIVNAWMTQVIALATQAWMKGVSAKQVSSLATPQHNV
jgi:hypothetical protein